MLLIIFGQLFVKQFPYAFGPLSCPVCLSVTLVYCGQTVGWIKMKLGMEVDLGQCDTVRWGHSSPPKRGTAPPPIFGPCPLWPDSWMD